MNWFWSSSRIGIWIWSLELLILEMLWVQFPNRRSNNTCDQCARHIYPFQLLVMLFLCHLFWDTTDGHIWILVTATYSSTSCTYFDPGALAFHPYMKCYYYYARKRLLLRSPVTLTTTIITKHSKYVGTVGVEPAMMATKTVWTLNLTILIKSL